MQVNPSAISLDARIQIPSSIRNWTLGQLFDAIVIGRNSKNSIQLSVNGTELRAATTLPLRAGQNLTLKVTQLRPVVTLTPVETTSTPQTDQIPHAIKQSLPMQRSLAPLLDFLAPAKFKPTSSQAPTTAQRSPTSTTIETSGARLPAAVINNARQLLQLIPNLLEVRDPARLPAIIRRLSVFSEAAARQHLVNGSEELPATDLKWQLLRLRGALRNSPVTKPPGTNLPVKLTTPMLTQLAAPIGLGKDKRTTTTSPEAQSETNSAALRHLSKLVSGAIAKIETNQFKAISALLDRENMLAFDLPLAVNDRYEVIKLKITRDEGDNDQDSPSPRTTIVMEIPLEEDAVLQAVVTFSAETLAVKLWSKPRSPTIDHCA